MPLSLYYPHREGISSKVSISADVAWYFTPCLYYLDESTLKNKCSWGWLYLLQQYIHLYKHVKTFFHLGKWARATLVHESTNTETSICCWLDSHVRIKKIITLQLQCFQYMEEKVLSSKTIRQAILESSFVLILK